MRLGKTLPAGPLLLPAAAGGAFILLRSRSLRWGSSDVEVHGEFPGDALMPAADLQATRAITIRATPQRVWPWIAQLGQGRGGFYSYDFLENLVGVDIHSATTVVGEWQRIEVGDTVRLAADVALTVAHVNPNVALVLRGAVPMGRLSAPYDFTWAFVLAEQADGGTRLVVRERYRYNHRWTALLVEPVEMLSFLMSTRMLRGIRERAEASALLGASQETVSAT